TDITCYGDNDGTATVTAFGGTTPLTYLWDDPSAQNTTTATGLAPGTYIILVTGADGCSASSSVTIIEPDVLTLSTNYINVTADTICDGSAMAYVSGGTTPYIFME
ncbi:MAG: SprB repeat-containing protein, partial [Bacteroidota bacterium]